MNRDLDNPEDNPGGFYSHKNKKSNSDNLVQNSDDNSSSVVNPNEKSGDSDIGKRSISSDSMQTPTSRPANEDSLGNNPINSSNNQQSGLPGSVSKQNSDDKFNPSDMSIPNGGANSNGKQVSDDKTNPNTKSTSDDKSNPKTKQTSDGKSNPDNNPTSDGKTNTNNNPSANAKKSFNPINKGLSIAKKGVNAASNTLKNVSNNITNQENNEPDDSTSSNKQTDQDVRNVASKVGKTAANVTGKIGKGLLKLFLKLPLIGKIVLILIVIIVIVLFIILIQIYITFGTENKIIQASSDDVCDFSIHVNDSTDVSLYNYIKGIVYTNYKDENENFIEAFTILVSSNIYNDYQFESKFDISDYNYYKFNYQEAPSIPTECIGISEESDSEKLKSCATELSISSDSTYDDILEDIKSKYGYMDYIKKAILKFYSNPTKSTLDNVNILKNYSSDTTLDYTALLGKFEDLDDINIYNVTQCSISEDGTYISGDGGEMLTYDGEIMSVRSSKPEYGNPYYAFSGSCTFQCVWYARNRAIELIAANGGSDAAQNAIRNTSGNGKDWNRSNSNLQRFNGDSTCNNIKAGSIIAVKGTSIEYGHVAIIEAVDSSTNRILISEGWNAYGGSGCNITSSIYNNTYTSSFGFRAQWWDMSVLKSGGYWNCYGITYLLEYN